MRLGKTVNNAIVLISTYKRLENGMLQRCLRNYVRNNGYGDSHTVHITDDGTFGKDWRRTKEWIEGICREEGVDAIVDVAKKNRGVGGTRAHLVDLAMDHAKKDDLLFCLDDDAYLQKNALKNMVKALDREPSCGVMGVMGPFRNFYYNERKPFEVGVFGIAYGIRAWLPLKQGINFDPEMRARADAMLEIEACLGGWKCMINPSSDAGHVRSIKNTSGSGHGGGGLASTTKTQSKWLSWGRRIVKKYPKVAHMDKLDRLHYLRTIKKMRESGEIEVQDIRKLIGG